MGRPLTNSFDRYITYPVIYNYIGYFKNIHPVLITFMCIITKYLSMICLANKAPVWLTIFLTGERILDCLDGEVARYYHKCSSFGHYLDKYSDVVFRLSMTYQTMSICLYANYYSLCWFILFGCTLLFPGLYVYDYSQGKITSNFENCQDSYSIILEDNATLICFILPVLISFIS